MKKDKEEAKREREKRTCCVKNVAKEFAVTQPHTAWALVYTVYAAVTRPCGRREPRPLSRRAPSHHTVLESVLTVSSDVAHEAHAVINSLLQHGVNMARHSMLQLLVHPSCCLSSEELTVHKLFLLHSRSHRVVHAAALAALGWSEMRPRIHSSLSISEGYALPVNIHFSIQRFFSCGRSSQCAELLSHSHLEIIKRPGLWTQPF